MRHGANHGAHDAAGEGGLGGQEDPGELFHVRLVVWRSAPPPPLAFEPHPLAPLCPQNPRFRWNVFHLLPRAFPRGLVSGEGFPSNTSFDSTKNDRRHLNDDPTLTSEPYDTELAIISTRFLG